MHMQHPVAPRRQRRVVRDQHQRRAVLAMAAEQKLDDFRSGRFVEIAGRLVGDDDGGIGRKRAGERDALLLAAGQFGRVMAEAMFQPDCGQLALGARKSIACAGKFERHGDVLQCRHGRNEMEGLEDDADVTSPEAGEFILTERLQVFSGNDDRPAGRPLKPGHDHEQRRFARARRSEQADRLTASYIQIDVSEDMNARGAAAERKVDPGQRNSVAGERMPRRVIHVSG